MCHEPHVCPIEPRLKTAGDGSFRLFRLFRLFSITSPVMTTVTNSFWAIPHLLLINQSLDSMVRVPEIWYGTSVTTCLIRGNITWTYSLPPFGCTPLPSSLFTLIPSIINFLHASSASPFSPDAGVRLTQVLAPNRRSYIATTRAVDVAQLQAINLKSWRIRRSVACTSPYCAKIPASRPVPRVHNSVSTAGDLWQPTEGATILEQRQCDMSMM